MGCVCDVYVWQRGVCGTRVAVCVEEQEWRTRLPGRAEASQGALPRLLSERGSASPTWKASMLPAGGRAGTRPGLCGDRVKAESEGWNVGFHTGGKRTLGRLPWRNNCFQNGRIMKAPHLADTGGQLLLVTASSQPGAPGGAARGLGPWEQGSPRDGGNTAQGRPESLRPPWGC